MKTPVSLSRLGKVEVGDRYILIRNEDHSEDSSKIETFYSELPCHPFDLTVWSRVVLACSTKSPRRNLVVDKKAIIKNKPLEETLFWCTDDAIVKTKGDKKGHVPVDLPELLDFDVNSVSPEMVVQLVGRRGSGKSWAMRHFLFKLKNHFEVGIVVSPTERYNGFFGKHIPGVLLHEKADEMLLKKFITRQQEEIRKGRADKCHSFLVLDDCLFDRSIQRLVSLKNIVLNGRHFKVFCMISSQASLGFSPEIRNNSDLVVIYQTPNTQERMKLWESYAGVLEWPVFVGLMNSLGQRQCLVINQRAAAAGGGVRDIFFKYRAEDPGDFKMCGEQLWALSAIQERRRDEQERVERQKFIQNVTTGGGDGKKQKVPELRKFDMTRDLETDMVVMCVGRRGVGKSWAIRDILYHMRDKIPVGLLVSPTERYNRFFSPHIPSMLIYDEVTPQLIQKFIARQKRVTRQWKKSPDVNPNGFCVLDDCLYNKKALNDVGLRNLILNGRHYRSLLIMSSQYALGFGPDVRQNTDIIIIYKTNIKADRRRLWEHYAGFLDYEVWEEILDKYTEDRKCLIINQRVTSSRIEDVLMWYKAEERPQFRMGPEDVWHRSLEYERERDAIEAQEDEGLSANDFGISRTTKLLVKRVC